MKRLSLRGNDLLSDFYCILTNRVQTREDALNFNEILAAVTTSGPFALTVAASVSRISTFTHKSLQAWSYFWWRRWCPRLGMLALKCLVFSSECFSCCFSQQLQLLLSSCHRSTLKENPPKRQCTLCLYRPTCGRYTSGNIWRRMLKMLDLETCCCLLLGVLLLMLPD